MLQDSEKLLNWLKSIKFDEYYSLFQNAAYDLQTVSRMTPEDLTAIGITKPEQRRRLKNEINRLNIEDGIPNYWPNSLDEWLESIRLTDYVKKLKEQGYTTLEKIVEVDVEDLEEIGITRLGHQKRIMLAIKKLQSLAKGSSSSNNSNGTNTITSSGQLNHYSSASSLQSSINLNSSLNSLTSSHSTTSKSSSLMHNNLYLPLQNQPIYQSFQEVAIYTNRGNSTKGVSPDGQNNNVSVNSSASISGLIQNGTPTTPELKTFQQVSTASNSTTQNSSINTQADQLTNGSISSSSNSIASSLNNSSNSAMNLPPLLNGQYGYLANGNVNSYHQLINGHHPQMINGQIMNGQLINGQFIGHNGMMNGQLTHPQQMTIINRGRSMESLPHGQQIVEPIYGVRQIVNGQSTTAIVDGQTVQVIYANNTHLQQPNSNEMYLIYNNDMEGTATLNRPKNLIKNRPVAKIAAKTRDLNELTDSSGSIMNGNDNITEQKLLANQLLSNQQIYGNLNGNNYNSVMNNTVIANNMINANLNNQYSQYVDNTIYENNFYIQEQQKLINNNGNNTGLQDRNSYIYATLKRGKKIPPPIPKRTNSMRTNGQPKLPLTAPTTPSAHAPSLIGLRRGNSQTLEDSQSQLTHQLNQLAFAQKLKYQLNNQRSSCSSFEVMQEEAFATCVKSLTSRFSMDSSSLDDIDLNVANKSTPTNKATTVSVSTDKTKENETLIVNQTNQSTVINQPTKVEEKPTIKEKSSITQPENENPLNQSTGSGDFPPPPSPSVLLDNDVSNSQNNSQNRPLPTTTPPLPSPPVLDSTPTQQTTVNDVNNKPLITQPQQINNTVNRTLVPQPQILRQQQYKSQANQFFKFDQPPPTHFECTVSSSSSTESVPFANDSIGTIMRPPKPNGNSNSGYCPTSSQLKQFAGSSSSSSLSSSASMTSSSTSSSLSSVSSNLNTLNNSNNNDASTIQPLIQSIQTNHLINSGQHQSNSRHSVHQSPYRQSSQLTDQQHSSPQNHQNMMRVNVPSPSDRTLLQSNQPVLISNPTNKIEHVVRSSVNCISNLSNHLNLSKFIPSSNSATNTAFRSLLGKPVQPPPQIPLKPATVIQMPPPPSAVKNWPCSPVKQLTSPEHVPKISQITNNSDLESTVINRSQSTKEQKENVTTGEIKKVINDKSINDESFESQQINSQSSPPLTNSYNESKYQNSDHTSNTKNLCEQNGYTHLNRSNSSTVNGNGAIDSSSINDQMEDIEMMLANLSTQLDAMLTQAF